ncbi:MULTISPECIES: hypothetical protein [unclassified Bartonella]
MTKDNQNILESNTPVNDNDNACLKAIPYEQALQQNGWGGIKTT